MPDPTVWWNKSTGELHIQYDVTAETPFEVSISKPTDGSNPDSGSAKLRDAVCQAQVAILRELAEEVLCLSWQAAVKLRDRADELEAGA